MKNVFLYNVCEQQVQNIQANVDLLSLLRNNEQDILAIIEKLRNIEYFNSLITSAKKIQTSS